MNSLIHTGLAGTTKQPNLQEFLEKNEDKVFWVFEILSWDKTKWEDLELRTIPGIYFAYANKITSGEIKDLAKHPEILILDLWLFLRGKINALHGDLEHLKTDNITILSSGKYDLFVPSGKNSFKSKTLHHLENHPRIQPFMTTLQRDNGANDIGLRTMVAGRMIGNNPLEQWEIEASEETIFLAHHTEKWYRIYIPETRVISNSVAKQQALKAIKLFLSEKYVKNTPENIRKFEENFWVSYESLKEILLSINEQQIDFYPQIDITDELKSSFPNATLAKNIRNITIDGKTYLQHVVYDEANNTLEVRSIFGSIYGWLPEGFQLLWKGKLYLESHRQEPKNESITSIVHANKKTLQHVRYVTQFVNQLFELWPEWTNKVARMIYKILGEKSNS